MSFLIASPPRMVFFSTDKNAHQSPKFHHHVSGDGVQDPGGRPAPRTRPHHAALTPTEVMLHLQGGSDQQKLEPNTVFIHVTTEEESSPMQERRLPPAVAARQQ